MPAWNVQWEFYSCKEGLVCRVHPQGHVLWEQSAKGGGHS